MRHYEKCFRFDARESPEDRAYRVALYRVRALRHFYRKVATALILIPFFFLVNAMTHTHYWWAWWPTLGFGIAILLRALALFVHGIPLISKESKARSKPILPKKDRGHEA